MGNYCLRCQKELSDATDVFCSDCLKGIVKKLNKEV